VTSEARRDAAVLAAHQARLRLDAMTKLLMQRAGSENAARRMLAVLDVVRPLVVAVENLVAQ